VTIQDLHRLTQHWIQGSDYDWKTAQDLFKSKKYPYCLFMCHLAMEKLLKAFIVKETKGHAPFTHNLVYLAGKISLELSPEQIGLLAEMNDFNIEARYPDEQNEFYKRATRGFAKTYKDSAGELREWLKKRF